METVEIVGWLASICMVLGYLPQAYVTIKTQQTDDIAMATFVMMGLGGFFFIIQGIMLDNWPLAVTNIITMSCSVTIFGIKIYNDYFKKRK